MVRRPQVVWNAGTSVVQVVVSGILLFLLYRYLIRWIGIDGLGVWSLVMSMATVARVSEAGFSGSVIKFVAKYSALRDESTTCKVVETAALSVAVIVGIALVAASPLIDWLLWRVVPTSSQAEARMVLPYALASFWLTMLSLVFQGSLDGLQRIDLRNMLLIAASSLQLLLAALLAPHYGLKGLAIAQVSQAFIVLVLSWSVLRRTLPALSWLPSRWNRTTFREMIRYAFNLQIVGFVSITFDPVTKALLSAFGGLATVGYFEMATRVVLQLRQLLMSTNQVLTPVFASLHEREPERIAQLYVKSYDILLFLAIPLYAGLVAITPLISVLWLGTFNETFALFALLLTVGWGINTLAGPAWFENLGTGRLRVNTLSQIVIGLLNSGLGYILGHLYGAFGVVTAWVLALVLGSSLIVVAHHSQRQMPLKKVLPKDSLPLLLVSLMAIAASAALLYPLKDKIDPVGLTLAASLLFLALVFIPLWKHPLRKEIARLIKGALEGGRSSALYL